MSLFESQERHVELAGCYNLRDIGGYPTTDGKQTRWRTVLRADSLHRLPSESQKTLLNYNIGTILDLRRSSELAEAPNVLAQSPGLTYLNISINENEEEVRAVKDLAEMYRLMLDKSKTQFRFAFTILATSAIYPVLIHCTAGKDRTGMVIALLLGLVNVPESIIAQDYALSADFLEPVFQELRQRVADRGGDPAHYNRLLQAKPEVMLETLEYLRQQYGGACQYLLSIGVAPEHLADLQRILVD